jgi:hypothetical protein
MVLKEYIVNMYPRNKWHGPIATFRELGNEASCSLNLNFLEQLNNDQIFEEDPTPCN